MKIGVLDIQGSVEEHFSALQRLAKKRKLTPVLVKSPEDFVGLSGLILPGGESTTIGDLLKRFSLDKEIIKMAKSGRGLYGTCAGAILLAKEIVGEQKAKHLGLVDVAIERNAYGRQMDSFETEIDFAGKKIPAVFIRAPKISKVGESVEVVARYQNEVIAVRQHNILLTTFHPELTEDLTVHEYFLDKCLRDS